MTDSPKLLESFAQPINAIVNGASRGIGLALVKRLIADPAVLRVFATSRHAANDETLCGLALKDAARLFALDMDVTVESTVSAAGKAVRSTAGQVNLIINCAGMLHAGPDTQPEKRLADVNPANLHRSFAVNAVGPLLIAKHFQGLIDREHRAVFASLSARVGSIGDNHLGGWYSYRASKAAQNMITKNLSIEMTRRASGLICVALHPGTVDTELSRPYQSNVSKNTLFTPDDAASRLLEIIDGLRPTDNGGFFAWDAQAIPW